MRKITQHVVGHFMSQQKATRGNTHTDGVSLWLHGNRIAYHENGDVYVSLCGWDTNTTRERLNGIHGVHVTTKQGQAFLNGKPWGGDYVNVRVWGQYVPKPQTPKPQTASGFMGSPLWGV